MGGGGGGDGGNESHTLISQQTLFKIINIYTYIFIKKK